MYNPLIDEQFTACNQRIRKQFLSLVQNAKLNLVFKMLTRITKRKQPWLSKDKIKCYTSNINVLQDCMFLVVLFERRNQPSVDLTRI